MYIEQCEMTLKNQFIMLCGLPASGKTTIRDALYLQNEVYPWVISSDDKIDDVAFALEVSYNDIWSNTGNQFLNYIQTLCVDDLKTIVSTGDSFIWDQTNLTANKRKRILDMVPSNYYKTCILVQCSDTEEWNKRLNSREAKKIPNLVINQMLSSFQFPSYSEGFDKIWLCDTHMKTMEEM